MASAYADTHDLLTGLPNRRCVEELTKALALDRNSDLVAVLIDFGLPGDIPSALRDETLRAMAQRLRTCARGDDVVALLNDNCFLILLTPRIGRDEEMRFLERLRTALAEPLTTTSALLVANVGLARCPEDGVTLDELLARATSRLPGQSLAH
jgi:diguanylate cyclase (GGDEF)-like protein